MNLRRSNAITLRVFRGFKHDPRSIGLMIIAPIVAMTVFGIAFGGDVTNVDIVIVNEDEGARPIPGLPEVMFSETFVGNLDEDVLNIAHEDSLEEALQQVKDGEKWAVIHFPPDFSRAVLAGNTTTISVQADQSNAQVFTAILTAMKDAAETTLEEVNQSLPVEVDYSKAVYGKGAEFSDFLIPGVIGFAIFLLTTLLTLLTFTSERVNNTLDRLLVTPATPLEIVIGYAIAFGIIGTIQAILLVTFGVVVFDIFVEGSLLLAIFITALLAIASMAFGILLSSAARTETQATQMIPLIVLPVFLLSGIFWPIQAIPTFLRPFSYALPPTYAVDGLRSVMIRGWGLAEVWPQILGLLVFVVLFLALAALSLRRKG
jgi:ABC-2 type transport system permease protein